MTTTKKAGGPRQPQNLIDHLIDGKKIWKGSVLACIINDEVRSVGYPRKGGIECLCHKKVFSMSNFELHAGSKFKKGSSLIFRLDGSGKSLAVLKQELEASRHSSRDKRLTIASTMSSTSTHGTNTRDVCSRGRELAFSQTAGKSLVVLKQELEASRHISKYGSNICGFCSRGGELTFCNTPSCPAAFHAECLLFQFPPDWYCHKCICPLCNDPLRTSYTTPESLLVLCEQCGDEYHMECVLERGDFSYNLNFKWLCSKECEETFEALGRIILSSIPPRYPDPVTVVRFSGDQDDIIFFDDDASLLYTLETRKAAEATRLFATLKLLERSFQNENHLRSQSYLFHNMLYPEPQGASRSIEGALNHTGFYAFLVEEGAGDPVISRLIAAATVRIHGKKVAEMPFIATSESSRGKGFCTQLMDGLQNILKGLEVQYLVVQSPPEFVDMWASTHSLHPVNDETKRSLLEYNLMKLGGRTLLCKTIDHTI